MRRLLPLLALALPAPVAAEVVPEGLVVHYACASGDALAAGYINPPGGGSSRPAKRR